MTNQYYIGLRKQINDDYDSLGVIEDYLTNDIDVQSAAVIYDFNMVLKNINEINTFGVLLFDIHGHFNLFKKLPYRVKFQKFMNFKLCTLNSETIKKTGPKHLHFEL